MNNRTVHGLLRLQKSDCYFVQMKESTFDSLLMEGNSSSPAPETSITALKEALYIQQHLLQNLYTELDEEREASASAASEALSMILRLQGEKASLKLEASQYKRMEEAKMCHAEEALAVVEDLIYQRELEIASLEYQVQAYRYRLLSMGCNDLGVYENSFPENLLVQRNDPLSGNGGAQGNLRRFNSSPQVYATDANYSKSSHERKRSLVPVPDPIEIDVEEIAIREVNDSEKKHSFWEQIKRLDDRVKEVSDSKDYGRNKSTIWKGGTWSPSLFSEMGIGTSGDATRKTNATHSDKVKQHQDSQESVQDIFEVPQTSESCKVPESSVKEHHKLTLEGENRLQKPYMASENILEPPNKDERDLIKTIMLSTIHEKKLPKAREGTNAHRNLPPMSRPSISFSNSQAEFQQLSQRVERLERARNNTRQEIISEGEEEVELLKEIREQLNSIQSEIRSLTTKKPHVPDEPPLELLQEVCLLHSHSCIRAPAGLTNVYGQFDSFILMFSSVNSDITNITFISRQCFTFGFKLEQSSSCCINHRTFMNCQISIRSSTRTRNWHWQNFVFSICGLELIAIFFSASGSSFAAALELLIRSASTMCCDQEE
ncbi:hypothetical protein DKX38_010073 [Salix brachista]|uniref:GTD-binding domain-containing protein n=1 Tax=Salix brachista TaxID=2182728 RepID=A0A5N5MCS4_9ROSI|nr:hypothetical protein DKX38_010073 [Salix brachista]